MHVEVITDRTAAGELAPEWSALVGRAPLPSVFLTPEWLLAWWDAYGAGLEMQLLAVHDGTELAAVVPLAIREEHRLSGRRRILQGWSNDYTDRFGPVVDAAARGALEAAVRRLADLGWHRLVLRPLSDADPATGWLVDALRAVGVGTGVGEWCRSPIVDLPPDRETLDERLSGSFRATMRRKVRKAGEAGLAAEVRTDAAALTEALDVAAGSWAHAEGSGIGSTPENLSFYRALAAAAEARGWLRLALLRDPSGAAIAFEVNLVRDGAAVNLKLGYREDAAGPSPGLVLRSHVVDALIAEGAETLDLLGADEAYKLHWTSRTVPHSRVRSYPPTLPGRARHVYRNLLRPALGSVAARLGARRGRG